jgi:hypothetical protein
MHYKLVATTFLAASLLGAPVIAYAQNSMDQGAPSTYSGSKPEAKAPAKHHKMHSSHVKPGTTTGMSSSRPGGRPISRKPPAS